MTMPSRAQSRIEPSEACANDEEIALDRPSLLILSHVLLYSDTLYHRKLRTQAPWLKVKVYG